jgi:hypothetical protein
MITKTFNLLIIIIVLLIKPQSFDSVLYQSNEDMLIAENRKKLLINRQFFADFEDMGKPTAVFK